MPGFLEGFKNVARDEHRHVAYGTWYLKQACAQERGVGRPGARHAPRAAADRERRAGATRTGPEQLGAARLHVGAGQHIRLHRADQAAQGDRGPTGRPRARNRLVRFRASDEVAVGTCGPSSRSFSQRGSGCGPCSCSPGSASLSDAPQTGQRPAQSGRQREWRASPARARHGPRRGGRARRLRRRGCGAPRPRSRAARPPARRPPPRLGLLQAAHARPRDLCGEAHADRVPRRRSGQVEARVRNRPRPRRSRCRSSSSPGSTSSSRRRPSPGAGRNERGRCCDVPPAFPGSRLASQRPTEEPQPERAIPPRPRQLSGEIRAEVPRYDELQEHYGGGDPVPAPPGARARGGHRRDDRRLLARFPDAEVTGLDSEPEMVFAARELGIEVRLARMEDPLPTVRGTSSSRCCPSTTSTDEGKRDLFRRVRSSPGRSSWATWSRRAPGRVAGRRRGLALPRRRTRPSGARARSSGRRTTWR